MKRRTGTACNDRGTAEVLSGPFSGSNRAVHRELICISGDSYAKRRDGPVFRADPRVNNFFGIGGRIPFVGRRDRASNEPSAMRAIRLIAGRSAYLVTQGRIPDFFICWGSCSVKILRGICGYVLVTHLTLDAPNLLLSQLQAI